MGKFLSRLVARRYKPLLIAVAGSLGKTTTKQAIATVLARATSVRAGSLTANDIAGALRTIVPGGALEAFRLLTQRDPEYPRALVLEYRPSHEGQMALCGSLVQPDIIVLTSLAAAHLDAFRSLDRLTREMTDILHCGKRDGWTVLSWDDERVRSLKARVKGRVMTYGMHADADVRAIEVTVNQEVREGNVVVKGTMFKLVYKGSAVPVHLPGVLGGPHLSGALAAAAIGIVQGMNLVSISEAFTYYTPTAGRMRLLPGIKRTLLIDDTYTASPTSCHAGLEALDVLAVRPGSEKFAIIGDMVPLGEHTEEGHRAVGEYVASIGVNYLITVGKLSRAIGRAAREKGMVEERVYHFTTAEEAGRFVQNRLEEGDCVYVSGNETMRMEKIIKEIMAEPLKADGFLVQR